MQCSSIGGGCLSDHVDDFYSLDLTYVQGAAICALRIFADMTFRGWQTDRTDRVSEPKSLAWEECIVAAQHINDLGIIPCLCVCPS